MKNNNKLMLALCLLLLSFALIFVSCDKGGEETTSNEVTTDNEVTSGTVTEGSEETTAGNSGDQSEATTEALHTHSWSDWMTRTTPNCVEEGEMVRTCDCGEIETEAVQALGHTEVITQGKAPTCLETGLSDSISCSSCGLVIQESTTIAITSHFFANKMCVYCGKFEYISDGLKFELYEDGKSYYVAGPGYCMDKEIFIPETYKGLPVTGIGQKAFSVRKDRTAIYIPNSVTTIEAEAFSDCTKLVYVSIPDSVTYIGVAAFSGCQKLENITIPKSVTSIEKWTFSGCLALKSIVIPDSVTSIGEEAFRYCTNLTSISIPDSITYIGHHAFYQCDLDYIKHENGYYLGNEQNPYAVLVKPINDSVSSCTIHKDTKYLCNGAFMWNSQLTSVTLPEGLLYIGNSVFEGCENLTSIVIPGSIVRIGTGAFSRCFSLTSVTILEGVTEICDQAFIYCHNLKNITIPNSVTSFGDGVFTGCESLKCNQYDNAYYLGNSQNPYLVLVKAIDTSIATCEINSNTEFIHSDAFSECRNLNNITIPDNILGIGSSSFYLCTSLSSISIPDGITYLGEKAFWACKKLTDIVLPHNISFHGRYTLFTEADLTEVTYKGTMADWKKIIINADGWWLVFTDYVGTQTIVHCTDGDIIYPPQN